MGRKTSHPWVAASPAQSYQSAPKLLPSASAGPPWMRVNMGRCFCLKLARRIDQHAFDRGAVVGLPLVGLALREIARRRSFLLNDVIGRA